MSHVSQDYQIACTICLDYHRRFYKCYLRCLYCFNKHLKTEMVKQVCPQLKPYLNQLRQKHLCNLCEGQGTFNKMVSLSINSQSQKMQIYQILKKDQNIIELTYSEEVVCKGSYQQRIYTIMYRRKQNVYQCPHCLGQKYKQVCKYRFCCREHCQKCKYTGFIQNQNWLQPKKPVQKCKFILKSPTQSQQQQQNELQTQELLQVKEQCLKLNQLERQIQESLYKSQISWSSKVSIVKLKKSAQVLTKKFCQYCYGQHSQKELKQNKLCPVVYNMCDSFRKKGICKKCSGSGQQFKQYKQHVDDYYQNMWIHEDDLNRKQWKCTFRQKTVQQQQFQYQQMKNTLKLFKQLCFNDRMTGLEVECEYTLVQQIQIQRYEKYYWPRYNDQSIRFQQQEEDHANQKQWKVKVKANVIYKSLDQFVSCFQCKGSKTANIFKLCDNIYCKNGCYKCNYNLVIRNKNCIKELKELNCDSVCSICCDQMIETITQLIQLECKHIFHEQCFQTWKNINNVCPNCRSQIKQDYLQNQSD